MRIRTSASGALLAAALFGALVPARAWAQADGHHVVQAGDTLYGLAERYLDDPTQWPLLQSLNQVRNPLRLMPGRTLVIPAHLMRAPAAAAEVLHVAGRASVSEAGAGPAPLAAGQRLEEGARIEIGDGGFVSLRLADGSEVRLSTGTTLRLRELRHEPASGRAQSSLELQRGRVDATVPALRPGTRSRFDVRTPLAVGGVRGTTFGVSAGQQGEFIGDVREGSIQVWPLATPPGRDATLVQAGEGARVGTGDAGVQVSRLLAAPDLSGVPTVQEDIAWIELPLPAQPGATAWQVRIASDDEQRYVWRNAVFTQPVARFESLDDGDYRLAVRSIDAHGVPGSEAVRDLRVNARPQAPLLLEPRQDSRVPAPDVELRCTERPDIEGYRFELARDAAFADLAASADGVAACRYLASGLPPGSYHWRVAAIARDAQGRRDQGPFSRPMAFAVVPLPPAPGPLGMRSDDPDTLSLQWGASPGGPWRHRIQIAGEAGFERPLDDRELAQPAYARPMPPPGSYQVRVRQIDADGLQGPWSDVQRLEVQGRVSTSDGRPLTSSEGQPVAPGSR